VYLSLSFSSSLGGRWFEDNIIIGI